MGIYNRNFFDPTANRQAQQKPESMSIVVKIILVTVGVFLLQLLTLKQGATEDSLVFQWLAAERDLVLRYGQVWRLLTYAFCHSEANVGHIIFNMLALFFLGLIVARTLGEREFLCVYLVAAVFAGMLQVCSMQLFSTGDAAWTLGASGAVSTVFVLFALHYPRLKLHIFGLIPIEARILLALVVAYDGLGFLGLVPGVFTPQGSSVGHAAHLGGIIFGVLYFRWDMNITRWWDNFAGRARKIDLPRTTNLKVFNPGVQPEIDDSEKIDEILAKISRSGESSLTARERRILVNASEHMKSTR